MDDVSNEDDDIASNPETEKGFITVGKKRSAIGRSDRDPRLKQRKQNTIENNDLPLSNSFSGLPVDDIVVDEPTISKKIFKPPPIHISDVTNYQLLIQNLTALAGGIEFYCKGGTNKVSVYPSTPELYRLMVKYLSSNNAIFHTYQLSEEKPHRVVLKGLHSSTPPSLITSELSALGFQVRNVVNIISRHKTALPMFFIDLENSSKTEEIYGLNRLLCSVIKIEEMRKNKKIVQCTRCQEYNHTKGYCHRLPRCVRCAGPHLTTECSQARDSPTTCVLCNGNHTANYRGCTVYQDLQRKRRGTDPAPATVRNPAFSQQLQDKKSFPALRNSNFNSPSASTSNSRIHHHSSFNNEKTSHPQVNFVSNQPSVQKFTHSYAQSVSGHHPVAAENDVSMLSSIMTNFLNDIKSLVIPLITLLSQLTQTLIQKQ